MKSITLLFGLLLLLVVACTKEKTVPVAPPPIVEGQMRGIQNGFDVLEGVDVAPENETRFIGHIQAIDGNSLGKCSGTLVCGKYVVTARHCVDSPSASYSFSLAHDPYPSNAFKGPMQYRVVDIAYPTLANPNPGNPENAANDVAILTLDKAPLGFRWHITGFASLAFIRSMPSYSDAAMVAYGTRGNEGFLESIYRQEGVLNFHSLLSSFSGFNFSKPVLGLFPGTHPLFDYNEEQSSCGGDSGSPIFFGQVFSGVTSFGWSKPGSPACGEQAYNTHTSIAHNRDWLLSRLTASSACGALRNRNHPPYVSTLKHITLNPVVQNNTLPVTALDLDQDELNGSATIETYAYYIDQTFGLRYPDTPFENDNLKWLRGFSNGSNGGWYAIHKNGDLVSYVSNRVIAKFDTDLYFQRPEYLVAAPTRALMQQLYAIDKDLNLSQHDGGYFDNGQKKWVYGKVNQFGNNWYYITKLRGELYAWNNGGGVDAKLHTLDPSVYMYPTLLHEALPVPTDIASAAYDKSVFHKIRITIPSPILGSFAIRVSVSDGVTETEKLVGVVLSSESPSIDEIDDVIFSYKKEKKVFIAANDPDNDPLVYSATLESAARILNQRHQFRSPSPEIRNDRGIWFQGEEHSEGNDWYFVEKTGKIKLWARGEEESDWPILADLGTSLYFDRPEYLHSALSISVHSALYQLDQNNDFRTSGNYYDNGNRKWVLGATHAHGNDWYYITKEKGELFAWNSGDGNDTLVATLDPSLYQSPDLMFDVPIPPGQAGLMVSLNGNEITISGNGAPSSVGIIAAASDGMTTVKTTFLATATNIAPVIDPIDEQSIPSGMNSIQVELSASDEDGDDLSFSAAVIDSYAKKVDDTYGLYFDPSPGLRNADGQWLKGNIHTYGNVWYWLTKEGKLKLFAGNDTTEEEWPTVASFGTGAFYEEPALLYDAISAKHLRTLYALDQARNFYPTGNYYDDGERKWFKGATHQYANDWYYIRKSTGELMIWNNTGGADLAIATLDPKLYDSPEIFFDVPNPEDLLVATIVLEDNMLTVSFPQDFTGEIIVEVTATDGYKKDNMTFAINK